MVDPGRNLGQAAAVSHVVPEFAAKIVEKKEQKLTFSYQW